MKRLLIKGIAVMSLFLMTQTGGILAQSLEGGGSKPKCKTGERCPSLTFNYCDTLASGDACVCYSCT
jgi:hypothetical protein